MDLSHMLVGGGFAIAPIGLGWFFFSRWQIVRPPLGVMGLGDVAIVLGCVVAIPLLYLAVPLWLLAGLLALGALSAVYVATEPLLSSPATRWLVILLAIVGEALAVTVAGPGSAPYFLVNNVVIVCGIVGVSNLWVQSGLKARDTAILGGALTAYDLIATSYLPLMSDLFGHLSGLPFAPIVGWPGADGVWFGIGLGDLVVATVFPLVMRKAYGRSAGLLALTSGSLSIVAILGLGAISEIGIFPVMVVLGPSMVIQYVGWSRRLGAERTTYQYARAERPAVAIARPSVPG